jgi:hypothetical protein
VSEQQSERLVILNRLLSRTITRAPASVSAPVHGVEELLQILEKRMNAGIALELIGSRLQTGTTGAREFIRIAKIKRSVDGNWGFATFLLEHVDEYATSFPVVNTKTYAGREIAADPDERGATAAHFVVRYPINGKYDDGSYRCALEHVSPISRSMLGTLLARQLFNHCKEADWKFPILMQEGKRTVQKLYAYHAKLELAADIGRSLSAAMGKRPLSSLVFVKRSEKQEIGGPATVKTEEVLGDVEIRVAASQGPPDPDEKQGWIGRLVEHFRNLGFETKMYFKNVNGGQVGGDVHGDIAGAIDLVMCPKEIILLTEAPKKWRREIEPSIEAEIRAILENDALWRQDS